RPARPQMGGGEEPVAAQTEAQRLLSPAVPDLGRPGRIGDRRHGRASGAGVLHLGLRLSAYRRLVMRGALAEAPPGTAARGLAAQGAGRECVAVLWLERLTHSPWRVPAGVLVTAA